jgi:hypothetical protein
MTERKAVSLFTKRKSSAKKVILCTKKKLFKAVCDSTERLDVASFLKAHTLLYASAMTLQRDECSPDAGRPTKRFNVLRAMKADEPSSSAAAAKAKNAALLNILNDVLRLGFDGAFNSESYYN